MSGTEKQTLPRGVTLVEDADGLLLTLRPTLWIAVLGFVVILVCLGVGAYFLRQDRNLALYSLFGLAVCYFALEGLVNRMTVRVQSNGLTIRDGPLPISRNRTIPVGDILHVCREMAWYSESEGSREQTLRFELNAFLQNGRKVNLLVCDDEDAVLSLAGEIQRCLGIASGIVKAELIESLPDSASFWGTRSPQQYRRARELLEMGQSRERVIAQLTGPELPERGAAEMVDEARREVRRTRRREARPLLVRGAAILATVGILVRVFPKLLDSGGLFQLVWFVVIYGIYWLVRGMILVLR